MMDTAAAATLAAGFALGLSLAAPPGPINALILERGARRGFLPGFAVGGGATTADACLCALMALGAVRVLGAFDTLRAAITLVGGALMLWFAWSAWRGARALDATAPVADEPAGARAGLLGGYATGFTLAITSPYNFAWWVSAGTSLFESLGGLVFVGFFAGILSWVAGFAGVVVWARKRAGRVLKWVAHGSAVLLAVFAVVLAWQGATALVGLL